MGDKQYQRIVRKSRASNMALRDIMRQSREQGAEITGNVIDGIYSNLGTSEAGLGRSMTNSHARNLAALARYGDRLSQGNAGSIRQGAAEARNIAGAAAPLAAPILRQAKGHAAAANIAMQGAARAGVTVAKGGQTILGILQAGAATAQAGAQGQLADALAYRARDDAKLIADRQNLILQSKLEFANWRRQQEYLQKLEEKDTTGKTAGISTVSQAAATSSATMLNYLHANPDATVDQLVAEATRGNTALLGNDAAQQMLAALAQAVKSTVDSEGNSLPGYAGYGDDVDSIMDAVLLMYPNYKGNKDELRKSIDQYLRGAWNARTAGTDGGDGGGGAPPTTRTVTTRTGAEVTMTTPGTPSDAQNTARNAVGQAYASEADAPPLTTGHYEERGQRGSTTTRKVWVVDGTTF